MALIVNGDITEITEGFLAHQVNCQNAMGSGVAKALYTKYPQVKGGFHIFSNKFSKPEERLGQVQFISVSDDLVIVNLFTQLTYGRTGKHTNEELLIKRIKELSAYIKTLDKTLYIPYKIGSGLGGGNWENIYKEIKHLDNLVIVRKD